MNVITALAVEPTSLQSTVISVAEAADMTASVADPEVTIDLPDFVVTRFWRNGQEHMIICGNQGSALLITT